MAIYLVSEESVFKIGAGSNVCMIAAMGSGDVAVSLVGPSVVDGKTTVGVILCNSWSESNPGDTVPAGEHTEEEIEGLVREGPIRMYFTDQRPIDVMIEFLNEAKRMLYEPSGDDK